MKKLVEVFLKKIAVDPVETEQKKMKNNIGSPSDLSVSGLRLFSLHVMVDMEQT